MGLGSSGKGGSVGGGCLSRAGGGWGAGIEQPQG